MLLWCLQCCDWDTQNFMFIYFFQFLRWRITRQIWIPGRR
jgi:hypothetical protein